MAHQKSEYDELKIKVDRLKRGAGSSLNGPGAGLQSDNPSVQEAIDRFGQEYINFKFNEWRPKMLCETCKDHEIEVFLPCGHMLCETCMNDRYNNRQRACPFCRKKISKNDVSKIYWTGSEGAQQTVQF